MKPTNSITLTDISGVSHTFNYKDMPSVYVGLGWSLEEYAQCTIDCINENIEKENPYVPTEAELKSPKYRNKDLYGDVESDEDPFTESLLDYLCDPDLL